METEAAYKGRSTLRRANGAGRITAALVGPPLAWNIIFFAVPVLLVAAYSLNIYSAFPAEAGWNLSAWAEFFGSSPYLGLFWKSVRTAFMVSAVCVSLAYPLAYFFAFVAGRWKYVLLGVLMVPFLTSYILRILAWKVLFGDEGLINSFVFWAGLRSPGERIPYLLYSQTTVLIVLIYSWVPFAALPIFVALENMDRRLLEAAADLRAGRLSTFWRIILPLSLPGLVAAFVFVLIPTLGEFVGPLLVGGVSGFLYGNAIADLFGPGFDWQTGSVLAMFLIAVVAGLVGILNRFFRGAFKSIGYQE